PYGWMLGAKIVMVALMLGCAAYHANKVRQQLADNRDMPLHRRPVLSAIRLSLANEMLLALGVIGLAAVIGLSSPFN
ncbi:MAG: CopD family protein, partial [Blastomonas fulva]